VGTNLNATAFGIRPNCHPRRCRHYQMQQQTTTCFPPWKQKWQSFSLPANVVGAWKQSTDTC